MKLVNDTQLDADLTSVANAIRAKGGTSADLAFPAGFVTAIEDIPFDFLGTNAELVEEVYNHSVALVDTGFNGWTPSTTAKAIIASTNLTARAINTGEYEYNIVWEATADIAADESAAKKALPVFMRAYNVQQIFRRPGTWAQIESETMGYNACQNLYTSTFLRYYGTTTGTITYTWATSYGFYTGMTAATFSSSTSTTPNLTIKTPVINARCSTTYMSTANAALIDQDNTTITIKGYLYRSKPGGVLQQIHKKVIDLVNGGTQ